jgi:SAM-dependent methyltransferase
LLDISNAVVERARQIFQRNQLRGRFLVGDATALPFDDCSFDIVFSIGLLEHFEDIETPLKEQIRVLAPKGLFLGYIVPEYEDNVQNDYEWINDILKATVPSKIRSNIQKDKLYRSESGSDRYLEKLKKFNVRDLQATGVYPLPMISYSTEFPFTLLDEKSEKILVEHFQGLLDKRKKKIGRNPWICDEGYGQAFLIWCYKR